MPDLDVGAYVAIGTPSDVVYAETNETLVRNLALLGSAAVTALATAWVGGQRFIIKRVHALLATTQRLAAGDLNARTNLAFDRGEFGQLARAFDQMAEALEQRKGALRRERDFAENLIETARIIVLVLDIQGRIVRFNQSLIRATEESELIQEICRIIVEVGGGRMYFPESTGV